MENDDGMFNEMDDMFNELEKQVCRIGVYLKANDCPAQLQIQLKELDDLLVHASLCQEDSVFGENIVVRCPYPKCYNGKGCYRHVCFCTERGCRLCNSMLQLVKFHAGQCTASNCRVPRCSEIKERKLRKERKLSKREDRLTRLRQKEQDLKSIYDFQMLESERAAAAAARKLSLKDGQGDQSNQNDVSKLLGDLSFGSSTLASKTEVDVEQKEEQKI